MAPELHVNHVMTSMEEGQKSRNFRIKETSEKMILSGRPQANL